MRSTVLTLSMTMLVFSGLKTAQAQESPSVEQAQFQQVQDQQVQNPQAQNQQAQNQQVQSTSVWQNSDEDGSDLDPADSAPSGTVYVRPRYWFTPPTYGAYFRADALFMARFHGPANQAIAVALPPGSIPNLHTQDASLTDTYRPGALFTLGFNLDQVSAIEGTYFGLNSWRSSAQVTDPAGLLGLAGTLQNSTTDYIFADRISINYQSEINSAEANYKQTIEGLTLLTGFRYFRMAETFDINSHSAVFGTSSDYKVNTVNQLIGAQIGMGYTWGWDRLAANLTGKIGPYANLSHQNTLLQDFGNTLLIRDYRADTTPISTLAEVGLNVTYQVNDWFSLHAGNRFIWIQNVAFAPDQLDLSNSPPGTQVMNSHNHLFLHAANVGAEIRW